MMSNKPWKKSQIRLERSRKTSRQIKETFLIICEGKETEPNYFDSFEVKSALIEAVGLGFNTVSLVNEALRIKKKKKKEGFNYDQIWCVFDRDDFHKTFNEAIFLAKKHDLKVAFSNESFELWYLLHFIYFDSKINRNEYIKKLKKYLPDYKKNDSDIYSKILEHQSKAIKNAKNLISSSNLLNPNKAEPCTTVVNLVIELNKYL